MAIGLWLLPVVMLSGAPAGAVPAGCEKRCEKQYVPCRDARVDQQMMCFEVVRRCELRCDGPPKKQKAQGRRRR